jgi:hypothetical protein
MRPVAVRSALFPRWAAIGAVVAILACGCPANAVPAAAPAMAATGLAMDVLANKHAFVPATIRGLAGTVRIEPDADVSYLLNSTRERLGLPLKDGMTPLPPFPLDGATTAETLVTVASPDQQARWLKERPDLLAVVGMDVLRQQPMLFDAGRGRFGWGDYLRQAGHDAVVVPMQAKVDQVPVIEAAIDGRPIRLLVAPWSSGLSVNGEAAVARQMLGTRSFQPQKRSGRYGWAMAAGQHDVAIAGHRLGRTPVDLLAPYVADSEDDQELPFIAEGWEGRLAPSSLPDWRIVIDYPQRRVRLFRPTTAH